MNVILPLFLNVQEIVTSAVFVILFLLLFYFFCCLGATTGDIHGVLLAPCSGINLDNVRGPYMMSEIKHRLVMYKANVLPAGLSLWPLSFLYVIFK